MYVHAYVVQETSKKGSKGTKGVKEKDLEWEKKETKVALKVQ